MGFVRAPVGMTFQELIKDSGAEALDLCMKEFAAAYENDRHNLQAWWGLGDDWRAGFRYVMWTVLRTDGRKLPGGTVQRAM
ncbi:hypothetical protein ABZ208_03615 [Streptomyces sp. NPDC006208]|uniref:hypothetical protein n=1 Tax=Streptomyces sp. NPDC006208 TaxID=3156734 RepID=UPI0033B23FE4